MISPLAFVDPAAKLGKNVTVQPFAYIEGDVEIGDDCIIMSGARILDGTRLGQRNKVHHGAVLGTVPQDFHYTGEKSLLIIGDQNDIRENVVVSRATHEGDATRIGNENFLMDGVHLCHDVQIGNHCVLGLKTIVAGDCRISDCTILSSNVILQQQCHIGSWVLIQSGCRIAKDVPPYVIMNGNPAGYHGINAVVLQHKHQVTDRILRHIVNAYRLIYQGNFSIQDALQKIEDQVPMSDEIHNILNFVRESKGIVNKRILLIRKAVGFTRPPFLLSLHHLTHSIMRKKKKKQTNSKKQLVLLIVLIICGIVTTYQTTNSKEKATGTEQTETTVQNLPLNSDIYIKQTTTPGTPEILLQRTGYLVSYNSNTRIANWVAWKLTPERLKENTERINNFRPDPDLPKSKAVTTQDYKGSGWDRGHLCPAGDNKWDREAMMESFYMTNICPQHHNLNRGDWNELEQKCRKWVKKDSCLYIVAGPIFYDRKPQTIGEHKVAVPDAFFKVILSLHKKPKAIGFIYKNNEGNNPLDSYVNTVDEVERITGIELLPRPSRMI